MKRFFSEIWQRIYIWWRFQRMTPEERRVFEERLREAMLMNMARMYGPTLCMPTGKQTYDWSSTLTRRNINVETHVPEE